MPTRAGSWAGGGSSPDSRQPIRNQGKYLAPSPQRNGVTAAASEWGAGCNHAPKGGGVAHAACNFKQRRTRAAQMQCSKQRAVCAYLHTIGLQTPLGPNPFFTCIALHRYLLKDTRGRVAAPGIRPEEHKRFKETASTGKQQPTTRPDWGRFKHQRPGSRQPQFEKLMTEARHCRRRTGGRPGATARPAPSAQQRRGRHRLCCLVPWRPRPIGRCRPTCRAAA